MTPKEEYEANPFDDSGFAICRHSNRPAHVALFVHGFNGSGHGAWKNFPKYLFEHQQIAIDVAAFDYRSGFRRANLQGAAVHKYVGQLAAIIAELSHEYSGGIFVIRAVRNLRIRQRRHGHRRRSVNGDAPIICCTAEILANIALRTGAASGLGVVITDEFHFYADPGHGWAWQVPLLELLHHSAEQLSRLTVDNYNATTPATRCC